MLANEGIRVVLMRAETQNGRPGFIEPSAWLIGTFVLTLAAAEVSLRLKFDGIALLWPAAGVGAGLLMIALGPKRYASLAGLGSAILTASLAEGRPLATALIFVCGNVLQSLLIAQALSPSNTNRFSINTLGRFGKFVAAAIGVPALIGLFMAVGLKTAGHSSSSFSDIWWIWLCGQSVGILTITPGILVLPRVLSGNLRLDAEHIAMASVIAVGAFVAVGLVVPESSPMMLVALVLMAPLAWWVLRSESASRAPIAVLIVAAVTIWLTTGAIGMFADRPALAQLFLAVISLGLLSLGVVRNEAPTAQTGARGVVRELTDARALIILVPLMLFAAFGWWTWRTVEQDARAKAVRIADSVALHAQRVLEVQETLLQL
ncbi:MAG: MASE1 domain-containing protein [Hyphomicrobiaceae bacterium]